MEAVVEADCIIDSDDEGAHAARGMEWCCNCKSYPYDSKLAHDLVNNRCYWSGALCFDYVFHVVNTHPLLSICCSHPAHPYHKSERFLVLIIISALTLFPSAALTTFWTMFMEQAENRTSIDVGEELLSFLSTKAWIILLFTVTLPVMILQVLLEKLIIADIYFQDHMHRGDIGCFCGCLVGIIRIVKTFCICFSCCAVIVLAVISVGFLRLSNVSDDIEGVDPWVTSTMLPLFPWAISRLQSWVIWFPLDAFMPCCGFVWKYFKEGTNIANDHLSDRYHHDWGA